MNGKAGRLGLMLITTLAIVLGILTGASAGSKEGCTTGFNRSETYNYTFDEVFQAAQETIQRMGAFVDSADKDKGIITGHGTRKFPSGLITHVVTFEIHVELLSAKPETNVRINTKDQPPKRPCSSGFNDDFHSGLQKLLVTSK